MAAISQSAPQHICLEIFPDLVRDDYRAERHIPARQSLRASNDIRFDAEVLRCQPFSSSSKSGHHFIVNQQNAVFVAKRPELGVIIVRRNQQAVGSGNPLHHHRGDGVWPFHLNNLFNVADTFAMARFDLLAKRATITIRVENSNNAGNSRLDGPAPRIARGGHRTHRGAMITAVPRDDFVAAGNEPRHFDGIFIGLGAAKREERFRQAGYFGEFFAERPARFSGKTWPREAKFIHLLLDGFQHFWMLVSDIEIDQLRAEVQPALVIAIPEPDALAAFHVNRIRLALHRPREHRVVAFSMIYFQCFGVHARFPPKPVSLPSKSNPPSWWPAGPARRRTFPVALP